jgi:hypothetical protein
MNPIPCFMWISEGSSVSSDSETHHQKTSHCLAGFGKVVVLDGGSNESTLFLALFDAVSECRVV